MKISALLLAVWYCISIIGFDIHVCHASNKAYLTTFVEGLSCEDVHPEHDCNHSCCHSQHDCHGDDATCESISECTSCCTNEYQVLIPNCNRPGNDDSVILLPQVDLYISHLCEHSFLVQFYHSPKHKCRDVGSDIVLADYQSAFSVWRI